MENKVIDESRQGEAIEMVNSNLEGKKLYLESYGCQMNFSDSEVVASILTKEGFSTTRNIEEADVILLNTCSIRENAEQRVRNRLTEFKKKKEDHPELVVGILGCMAERLKKTLLEEEKLVDLVAGPDAYRDLQQYQPVSLPLKIVILNAQPYILKHLPRLLDCVVSHA